MLLWGFDLGVIGCARYNANCFTSFAHPPDLRAWRILHKTKAHGLPFFTPLRCRQASSIWPAAQQIQFVSSPSVQVWRHEAPRARGVPRIDCPRKKVSSMIICAPQCARTKAGRTGASITSSSLASMSATAGTTFNSSRKRRLLLAPVVGNQAEVADAMEPARQNV